VFELSELSTDLIRAALLHYAEEELDWGNFGEYINYTGDSNGKTFDVPGLGIVTIVDHHGYDSYKNYDGWEEHIWVVFEIQGKLYKATGTHTSYTGSEWDRELKEVSPKEKTITVYE
jgi:hypothetical protein